MPIGPPSSLLVVGSPGALAGPARNLRRKGYHVHRLPLLRFERTPGDQLARALRRFGEYDTLLLTSPRAVEAVLPAVARTGGLRGSAPVEVIAIGPVTRTALRRRGVATSWTSSTASSTALVSRFAGSPSRRIVYPRSDAAGGALARQLRTHGHTVLDLVTYRLRPTPVAPARATRWIRKGHRVVVTSPSALRQLRRSLSPPAFRDFRRRPALLVLGERTTHSARGHGFRGVRIAPDLSTSALTRFLLRELDHGR